MRKKNFNRLLTLGGILFLLILFLFSYEKISKLIEETKNISPFKTLKQQDIKKIIFEKENKKYEIYKKNNSWYLKEKNIEFKADKEKIEKIIEAIIEIKKEEIISKNKSKHQEFGIGKNKIKIFTQNKQITFYVGNNASFNTNYLRINEENEVFLGKNFDEFLTTTDWRDLKINLIEKEEDIEELTLNYEGKTLFFKKEKNQWTINQKKAKKDRVDFFINEIATLKANDILPYENISAIDPSITLQIKAKNQIKKAYFFEKDKDNYWLTTSFNHLVYQLSNVYISSLKKNEEDFIQ
jgi:hypothetical protein